ncbi:MAG: peroxiredoxin family protein [Planctomycetota bacterium]
MRLSTLLAPSLLAALLATTACTGGDPAPEGQETEQPKKKKTIGGLKFHDFTGQEPTNPEAKGKPIRGEGVALVNAEGKEVTLASLLGKPLVLVFMRGFNGDICPYCTTYTAQMAARYAEFREAGAEILVVYPTREGDAEQVKVFKDIVKDILSTEGEAAIPFPVYLDLGTRVVKHYNLVGDLSKPSTFVLDPEGKIQYLYVGRDTDDRPALDRVLEEVRRMNHKKG